MGMELKKHRSVAFTCIIPVTAYTAFCIYLGVMIRHYSVLKTVNVSNDTTLQPNYLPARLYLKV